MSSQVYEDEQGEEIAHRIDGPPGGYYPGYNSVLATPLHASRKPVVGAGGNMIEPGQQLNASCFRTSIPIPEAMPQSSNIRQWVLVL